MATHNVVHSADVGIGLRIGPSGKLEIDPAFLVPEYRHDNYFVEESGNLSNSNYQWSWGNGDTGFIGVPIGSGCEIIAFSFNGDNAGANDTVSIDIVDMQNGQTIIHTFATTNQGQANNYNYYEDAENSPIALPDNMVLGFRTRTEVGIINGARIGLWTRRETGRMILAL